MSLQYLPLGLWITLATNLALELTTFTSRYFSTIQTDFVVLGYKLRCEFLHNPMHVVFIDDFHLVVMTCCRV